ncbi:hypothetical protein E3N88_36593 [Mikania micrantha]|uniref:Uncharacterized protein n=1 Tax=Mikania micrantha TaxID=192012 RepID=A0A5N6M6W6_9ASTR|nr:hypothetical protein E3N88_36593 [Mikania micrantha]
MVTRSAPDASGTSNDAGPRGWWWFQAPNMDSKLQSSSILSFKDLQWLPRDIVDWHPSRTAEKSEKIPRDTRRNSGFKPPRRMSRTATGPPVGPSRTAMGPWRAQ